MITFEFEQSEDALRLAINQDGHAIGHVETLDKEKLLNQATHLQAIVEEMLCTYGKLINGKLQ